MRLINKIIFIFFLSFVFISQGYAYLLEEQVIETPHKKCKIYYLTEKNTHGWHIETDREECESDKLLRGYHNITVYNAFSKPVEKLYGYFSAGYWTGDSLLPELDLKRFSDELGVQKATFPVYSDLENNIFYIGQMSSKKTAAGTYPAFRVCAPFRVLGIISDTNRLNNPHFLQTIFQNIEKQTRRFCPAEKEVQLYLSDTDNPSPEEVYMYVQMDLKTHHHKIMRSPKASRQSLKSQHLSEEWDMDEDELYQTLIPVIKKAKRKSALYRALSLETEEITPSDIIDEVIEKSTQKEPIKSEKSSQIQEKKIQEEKMQEKSDLPDEFTADLKNPSKSQSDFEPVVPTNENTIQDKAASYFDTAKPAIPETEENFIIPTPRKSYLTPLQPAKKKPILKNGLLDVSDQIKPASHLLLLAYVLKIPVKIQTILNIKNNQAFIHNESIKFSNNPSDGWYIVKGILSLKEKKHKTLLSIQTQEMKLCQKPYCIGETE